MANEWQYIPEAVLDDQARVDTAQQWAAQQRTILAQNWAASQQEPPPLAQAQPPVRDDWAVNPGAAAGVNGSPPTLPEQAAVPPPMAATAPPAAAGTQPDYAAMAEAQSQRIADLYSGKPSNQPVPVPLIPPSEQPAITQPAPGVVPRGVLDVANSAVGSKYVWGGAGGRSNFDANFVGSDCSGFVSWAMKNGAGIDLPAQTSAAYTRTAAVSADDRRPGDVIFFNMGQGDHLEHIAIYAGNGMMIHDSSINPNGGVQLTPVWSGGEFRRPTGPGSAEARATVGSALQAPQSAPSSASGSPLDGLGNAVGQFGQSVAQGAQDMQGLIQQSLTRALSPDEQNRLTDMFREQFKNGADAVGQVAHKAYDVTLGDQGPEAQFNRGLRAGGDAIKGAMPAIIGGIQEDIQRSPQGQALTAGLQSDVRKAVFPTIFDPGYKAPDLNNPDDALNAMLGTMGPGGPAANLGAQVGKAVAPAAGSVLEQGLAMMARADQQPNLIQKAVKGLGDVGPWIERNIADKYAPLNHLSDDIEQGVGLFQGRAGAAVQRVKDDLGPALKELSDESGDNLLPYLNMYRKYQLDIERIGTKGPRAASAGVNSVAEAQQGLQEIQQTLGARKFARVERADGMVQQALDGLLQDKVDAGLVSQDLANQLRQMYPHYNPVRVLEAINDGSLGATGKRLSQNSNLLRRLSDAGSGADTESPIRSAIRAIVEGDAAIRRNDLAKQISDALVNQGLGQRIPNVKLTTGPVISSTLQPVGTVASRFVGDVPGAMTHWENGKPVLTKGPDDLIKLIKGMDDTSMGIFTKLGNALNAPLRAGATALSPAFIPTNAVADALTMLVREGPGALKRLPGAYLEAAREGPTYQAYAGAGGLQSSYMAHNPASLEKAIQESGGQVIGNQGNWLKWLGDVAKGAATLAPVRRLGEIVENGPRLATFSNRLAQGQTVEQAALAGRRVTVDFARSGSAMKIANAWVPFLNARVQGALQVGRTLRDIPDSRARFGALTAVAASTYLWNKQFGEEYKDIPNYVKDQYAVVILGHGEKNENGVGFKSIPYVALPLRELSVVAGPIQHVFASIDHNDPRSWQQFAADWARSISPVAGDTAVAGVGGLVPAPLRSLMESQMNQRFYSGSPIVSKKFEGTPPSAQFDERTGVVSKAIADALGFSPKGLDFMIQENLGGFGRAIGGDINPLRGLVRTQGGQTEEGMYQQLGDRQGQLIEKVGNIVRQSPEYQKATPDRQLQMLRTASSALTTTLKDQIGIPESQSDLGLPEKYRGVHDPIKEQAIDHALSKYNAWNRDRKNNPKPTPDEQRLAMRYLSPDAITPAYTKATQSRRIGSDQVNQQVRSLAGVP